MSLASFGVTRILRFVMMNKSIKSKRNVFMIIDLLLQSALVGNILWIVMFITKEVSSKNYIVLLVASIAAGVFSSFVDANKIFNRKSKISLTKPQDNDKLWMIFYIVFIIVYLILDIVLGIKLLG